MSIVVAGFNRNHSNMSSTTLGGLSSNSEKAASSAWKAQCKTHSQAQSNPYIRAIFSYIASGDWRDVLEEKSLSLADRVGVALRFLSDDEVSRCFRRYPRCNRVLNNVDMMRCNSLVH